MGPQQGHDFVVGLVGTEHRGQGGATGREPTHAEDVARGQRGRWSAVGLQLPQGRLADVDMVEAQGGGLLEAGPCVDASEDHAVHPERVSVVRGDHGDSSPAELRWSTTVSIQPASRSHSRRRVPAKLCMCPISGTTTRVTSGDPG